MSETGTESRVDADPEATKEKSEKEGLQLHRFTGQELNTFLREMLLYRRFEEEAEKAYAIGKIGGFCHLHIGQEGVSVGCIRPLRRDDYVVTAYREHTQALAKGVSPRAAMAELFGRATGVSGGRGGSMHLFSASDRFMGGHGIVGGQVPLAAGIGFAIKYRGGDQVCMCFMGDAAVNQGAFHEALNMAAVWRLPVIFVVENNDYGMGTKYSRVSARPIAERAEGTGVPASQVNGQDVLATYRHFESLIEAVRSGGGPRYVDVMTYRFKGHSMSDPSTGVYRTKEEVDEHMRTQDPITVLKERMERADIITDAEFHALDGQVKEIVTDASEWADAQPFPDPDELYRHVYADEDTAGRLYFDGRDR